MTIHRQWYCDCSGEQRELPTLELGEDEPGEATCEFCGATPSSDPRHTVSYRDLEDRND